MRTILVTDYLENTARKFPDKIAFADERREMTFSELRKEALSIAEEILMQGVRQSPVVVFMEKSPECVAAFMGAAYSGNFYTPLDTKMPVARIKKIIETLSPHVIITTKALAENGIEWSKGMVLIIYEEVVAKNLDTEKVFKNLPSVIDTDVLYVLFTSGSTGTPKGVIIGHRSVIDYTEWLADTFHFYEHTVFGNQAPFYFDNSVLDIYSTLRNGATCVLIPEEKFSFPIRLLEYLQEHKVNTLFWVPSALCLVVNLKALHKRHVDTLEKILFAGEVMPNKHLNLWRDEYPNVLFANLYGPTEITVDCTAYIVDRVFADDELLPIGHPCRNTDILVLDEADKLVTEAGMRGELCVRGTSLAYGYWNAPRKTKEAFVQNPLQDAYPEVIYRTGDIVEYNERGELLYLCRKDFQIKHMGHRIELGEIETIASSLEGVQQNCCLYDEENGRIVLFYSGALKEIELIGRLQNMLPAYMLPTQVHKLAVLPLNMNGKIDRVTLKNQISKGG